MEGNFTQIPNNLMEILMNEALSESERRILLFIARKTYGYQKKSDTISYSQFQNKLNIARSTVGETLKRLRLVGLIVLVKKGKSRLASNEWLIDLTDYQDKLVRLIELVRLEPNKLVRYTGHTKESITKERGTPFKKKTVRSPVFGEVVIRKGGGV